MEIVDLGFEEAGILAPLYNQFAEDVPFSFPVTEDEFAVGIRSQWEDHGYHKHLRDQHLLVCRRAGKVAGFAHVAVGPWDSVERGIARFICYLPGDRATGQQLLESSERRLRELGASERVAFPRGYSYPFRHIATETLSGKLARFHKKIT